MNFKSKCRRLILMKLLTILVKTSVEVVKVFLIDPFRGVGQITPI